MQDCQIYNQGDHIIKEGYGSNVICGIISLNESKYFEMYNCVIVTDIIFSKHHRKRNNTWLVFTEVWNRADTCERKKNDEVEF